MSSLAPVTPTEDLWGNLQIVFNYLNDSLFDSQLPDCILNFATHRGSKGYFTPKRWVKTQQVEEVETSHEISLNPMLLNEPKDIALSWLCRQMVHLWQAEYGIRHCGHQRYYNREFNDEMLRLGLPCSDDGTPQGKKTGFRQEHWIEEDGLFAKTIEAMPEDIFPWKGYQQPISKKPRVFKYACSTCQLILPALSREVHLTCNTRGCNQVMELIN